MYEYMCAVHQCNKDTVSSIDEGEDSPETSGYVCGPEYLEPQYDHVDKAVGAMHAGVHICSCPSTQGWEGQGQEGHVALRVFTHRPLTDAGRL